MRNRNVLIVVLAGVLTVHCIATKKTEPPKCNEYTRAENTISVPPYTSDCNCQRTEETKEKLQYKAESNGTPYFEDKVIQSLVENGARYPKGPEFFVNPDPGFIKTKEVISEENEEILLAK